MTSSPRLGLTRTTYELAQAVSWLHAEQTSTWYAGGNGEIGRIRPYRVRYEELDADMAGVSRRVLGFLGLEMPGGRAVVARHRRQADTLNARWIDRYRKAIGP